MSRPRLPHLRAIADHRVDSPNIERYEKQPVGTPVPTLQEPTTEPLITPVVTRTARYVQLVAKIEQRGDDLDAEAQSDQEHQIQQ